MRIVLLTIALMLTFSLLAGPAIAQEDRKIVYKTKTEIDFEDVDVSGELKKPHGSFLLERRRGNFNPLIKIRSDFNEEIFKSVDEVR